MDQFSAYLFMGFEHMADLKGYDHMLFVIVLCAAYRIKDWKKVLILVTAFTIGHSVTLAMAGLKIIVVNSKLIELLIPITILSASLSYLFANPEKPKVNLNYNYAMALLFGFIHGMGFSNFFNALMGDSMDVVVPLFAFNMGLEMAQLMVVILFFTFYYLLTKVKEIKPQSWTLFFAGIGTGVSVIMILERI